MATVYSEVTPADRDVVAFIAGHAYGPTLVRLGLKHVWAARQDGAIVGILALRTQPYIALNYLAADENANTFMRLWKLWKMAKAWLVERGVPVICAEVHNSRQHFQLLLRRLGFTAAARGDDTIVYALNLGSRGEA